MKGLLEQMRESRINVVNNNMLKDDGSFVYDQRRLVLHTGLCGIIEFEIAIHYLDKNWVHPKAVKTHPPFIRSAGIHVGVDATGKRWRYHRVNGITYWIEYGWEYAKYKSRFSLWEIHTQNLLLEYTVQTSYSRFKRHGKLIALLPNRQVLCEDGTIMNYYFHPNGSIAYIERCSAMYEKRPSAKLSRFNLWEESLTVSIWMSYQEYIFQKEWYELIEKYFPWPIPEEVQQELIKKHTPKT